MAKLPWFRLYSRIIHDDKIRLLAFEDRWHFVAICCMKSDGVLDDTDIDLRDRRIAVNLGVQLREVCEIKRRLVDVRLIDAEWSPVAWNDLQYQSDTSTERTRKYRERLKGSGVKRRGDVTVTGQDTDTDTDTDKKKDLPPSAPKQQRKTRLPGDHSLTEEMRGHAVAYWADRDRPDLDPVDEHGKFTAHHRGRGSTMANWGAAWQTWYSNAVKFNPPPKGGTNGTHQHSSRSAVDRVNDAISRRAREREETLSAQGRTFDHAGNIVETI